MTGGLRSLDHSPKTFKWVDNLGDQSLHYVVNYHYRSLSVSIFLAIFDHVYVL